MNNILYGMQSSIAPIFIFHSLKRKISYSEVLYLCSFRYFEFRNFFDGSLFSRPREFRFPQALQQTVYTYDKLTNIIIDDYDSPLINPIQKGGVGKVGIGF